MSLVARFASPWATLRRHFGAPRFAGVVLVRVLLTLGAGAISMSACDDDGEGMVVDAGSDVGLPACKVADCAGLQMPMHPCMNGSKASYVCARGAGGRCIWDQPVCAAEPGDGGDGPTSEVGEVGDGGPDDDATDAPADGTAD